MLLKETKDYVNDEVLPDEANGYSAPKDTAEEIIEGIEMVGSTLLKPTKVAKNILQNQDEFTDYVVEAFKELEGEK